MQTLTRLSSIEVLHPLLIQLDGQSPIHMQVYTCMWMGLSSSELKDLFVVSGR